jgi:glycosidase
MKYMLNILLITIALLSSNCSKKADESKQPADQTFNEPAFNNVPDVSNMVVYEVNLSVFSATENLKGATQRLDSLKNLGINVVWLMPIYPVGYTKSIGSPYCVNNYTSINPSYGTLDDLRDFVRTAHQKNMAVILDWVADHTSWDNPWITAHKSWYMQDSNGNILPPAGTNWTDVAQLDYSNSTMRAEMIKCMKYWINQSNIDGFRFDAVDFVPSNFWQQATDSLKSMAGRKIILLAEGGKAANFTDGFQMNYSWNFSTSIKAIFKGSMASTIFATDSVEYSVVPAEDSKLRYITNHDESYNGSLIDYYNTIEGSLAAFVATAFQRGVPLIYNGQEVGCPTKIPYFQQGTLQPLSWNINPEIYNQYKKIMNIRSVLSSVKTGNTIKYPDDNVIAFKRYNQTEEVLVLVNVRGTTVNYTIPSSLQNTNWTNLTDNSIVNLATNLNLTSYSYLILKR